MKTSPVFPLGTSYLPGDAVALNIFEERYLQMIADMGEGDHSFVSVLIERGHEVGGDDLRHRHGVHVTVDSIVSLDSILLVRGTATTPCEVVKWLHDDPYPMAEVVDHEYDVTTQSQRYDIASSLSLLAQDIRSVHAIVDQLQGSDEAQGSDTMAISVLAGGRWWDELIKEEELWRAFWLLARNVPCGPFDRYSFLVPGTLTERVKRLKQTVEHVREVLSFRFGQ